MSSVFVGLFASNPSLAQQPPAWSPQPFQKPIAEASNAPLSNAPLGSVPQNSLRSNSTSNASTASNALRSGEVHRWRDASSESTTAPRISNYSQSIPRQASEPPTAASNNAMREPRAQTTVSEPLQIEPRSSFALNPPSPQPLESKPQERNSIRIDTSAVSSPTTNGVWYDRSATNSSALERLEIGSASGNSGNSSNAVQMARYQEPPILPSFGLPPAQSTLPPADLSEQSKSAEPPKFQDPSNRPGRSLLDLESEPVIPSPFPSSKNPRDPIERSPSDASEPSQMNPKRDMDKAPAPPRRRDPVVLDCNVLRDSIKEFDITKINVDSSPSFIEVYKSQGVKSPNTKEGFVASAQIRTWYNFDGEVIAEGKLVDVARGSAIIEQADGKRTTYLLRKLSDSDRVYAAQAWGFPITCSLDDRSFESRDFVETTMTWKATGACHKPLYFEEVQLERYGHEWGPFAQPVISSAHFFGNIAVLPYKMGIHPMNECQYSLGYYRPGSCAPWTVGPVPLSLRGALNQASVVGGIAWALP
ncbi:MAG: hypothetical protein NTU79_12450 [Planctomycetota bacterium]|nr:hypothetical protein [Planctomycetota bacterium]